MNGCHPNKVGIETFDLVLLHHLDLTERKLIRFWRVTWKLIAHLFQLFAPFDIRLKSNTREDDSNHEPLTDVEDMSIGDHRKEDGKELSRHGDSDQGQGSKMLEGVKDEALPDCSTDTEECDILDDSRVRMTKRQRIAKFRVERVEKPNRHEHGHEQVHEAHHLLPGCLERVEDLVLSRIGHAIDGQVDEDEEHAKE